VDDVVFAEGEVEIRVLPIGPADIRTQKQLAADHGSVGLQLVRTLGSPDHALEAPDQNLRPRDLQMTSTAPLSKARHSWDGSA